jgi:ribosome-associated translation inhibitor RaiA
MQIQVTTDNAIAGSAQLSAQVQATVEASLTRFTDRLTRVEVHLGDENGLKRGDGDKRCVIEARPRGTHAVAVTNHADSLDAAIDGAVEKLEHLLDHTFGRLADHHRHQA